MSLEQLESKLMSLPSEQRRRFAHWFYAHEHEILQLDASELNPVAQQEILRRREELRSNPGLAVPVTDEWFEQLKRKLAGGRAAQTPAR